MNGIAFKDFIVASEVFNFLQPIAKMPSELSGLNNEFKYFSMLDQEYLNHFKNVVKASRLSYNLNVFLSTLYLLKKERWPEFDILLRKYINYFLCVSEGSLYEALSNKLKDEQDISVEVLGAEFISLYNHRMDLDAQRRNQLLIRARQFQRQSFLEEIDYYKQSIAFICSQRLFRETPTVLDALWSVINGVNNQRKNNGHAVQKSLKNMREIFQCVRGDQKMRFWISKSMGDQAFGYIMEIFYFLYGGDNYAENLNVWSNRLINQLDSDFASRNGMTKSQNLLARMFTALREVNHGNAQLNTIFAESEKLLMFKRKLQDFNGDWAQKAYEFGVRHDSTVDQIRAGFKCILSDYLDYRKIDLNQGAEIAYDTVVDHCVDNIFPNIKDELKSIANPI